MWSLQIGSTGGLSNSIINNAISTINNAVLYLDQYIDSSRAVIDVQINFSPLGEGTLGEGGFTHTNFVLTANGFNYFEPVAVTELRTGVDTNGTAHDIVLTINSSELLAGELYFGAPPTDTVPGALPSTKYDLSTLAAHEILHGLGFLSGGLSGGGQMIFDRYVSQSGSSFFFNGPNVQALRGFFGVGLDSDRSHIAHVWSGPEGPSTYEMMNPTLNAGVAVPIKDFELAILADIGVPLRRATSADDTLFGVENFKLDDGQIQRIVPGNDYINGLGGFDIIKGLSGNDTLLGGANLDHVYGGSGHDMLDGGDANDTLFGGEGVLAGEDDDDILIGGRGSDYMDGGVGIDTAMYTAATAGVAIYLASNRGLGNDAENDVLHGIENIQGSKYADTLNGADSVNNKLSGNDGNDILIGLGGADTLAGAAGNDTLRGGAGGDLLSGSSGVDMVDYTDATGKVTVRLSTQTASGNVANGDVLSSIESVVGGNSGDLIVGSDNVANFLAGKGGKDTIEGLSGNDTIRGGLAADKLDGDDGIDTVDYTDAVSRVTVRLWNQTASGDVAAAGDTLAGFEDVFGGAGDDLIAGSDGVSNYIVGNRGNDALQGLSGNDTLVGGSGNDSLWGGTGNDRFAFAPGCGADRIYDMTAGSGPGDVLRILNFGTQYDTFAEVLAAATQSGSDTIINFGGGDTITLIGISKSLLSADDIAFI